MGRYPYPRGCFAVDAPPGARLTLAALWSFARWWAEPEPWVFPTTATLARVTAQDERSVWRHLRRLVGIGAIRRERRPVPGGGKHDGWALTRYPDPLAEVSGDPDTDDSVEGPDPLAEVSADPDTDDSESDLTTCHHDQGDPDTGARGTLAELSGIRATEDPRKHQEGEGKPRRTRQPSEVPSSFIDAVLDLMCEAVRDVTSGRSRGPRNVEANRNMVRKATRRERATLEDWRHVIWAQANDVRHKPAKRRFLCLSTITRPENWARLADAPEGRDDTPAHAPSLFDNVPPDLGVEAGDFDQTQPDDDEVFPL